MTFLEDCSLRDKKLKKIKQKSENPGQEQVAPNENSQHLGDGQNQHSCYDADDAKR